MRHPNLKLLLVLAAAAFLAAGCGGGGDSTGASPATKAEFIKRADLICRKADARQPREQEAFRAEHEKKLESLPPRGQDIDVMVAVTLPSVKGQIRELESLKAPAGEAKQVNAIIAGWNATLRGAEKNPYPATRWDLPAVDPFTPINKVAVRYGFNDCRDLR